MVVPTALKDNEITHRERQFADRFMLASWCWCKIRGHVGKSPLEETQRDSSACPFSNGQSLSWDTLSNYLSLRQQKCQIQLPGHFSQRAHVGLMCLAELWFTTLSPVMGGNVTRVTRQNYSSRSLVLLSLDPEVGQH